MSTFSVAAIAAAALLLAAGAYRALRGWRVRRRTAWEVERAAWRRWIMRR